MSRNETEIFKYYLKNFLNDPRFPFSEEVGPNLKQAEDKQTAKIDAISSDFERMKGELSLLRHENFELKQQEKANKMALAALGKRVADLELLGNDFKLSTLVLETKTNFL